MKLKDVRKLHAEAVRTALNQNSVNYKSFWRRPQMGYIIRGSLAIVLLTMLSLSPRGEPAERA